MSIEHELISIIERAVIDLGRNDLYRAPLVAISDASDERYTALKDIVGPWVLTPREFLPSAQSVISYFVPFTHEVVDAPPHDPLETSLWGESYAVINDYFNTINQLVCEHLQSLGYEACPVPSGTFDVAAIRSTWSHRSAAAIAGLGYFSANRMLVTDKGSAGRYSTVFTSAPLLMRRQAPVNRCGQLIDGSCGNCFTACPVGALTPVAFDKSSCLEETLKNERLHVELAGLHDADTCGRCINACPLAYFE